MPARPSELPRWADLADPADIVEPSEARKDAGWPVGYRPPSQNFNWLQNQYYNWLNHLADYSDSLKTAAGIAAYIAGQAPAWSVLQNFGAGLAGTTGAFSGALSAASAAIVGAITGASVNVGAGLATATNVPKAITSIEITNPGGYAVGNRSGHARGMALTPAFSDGFTSITITWATPLNNLLVLITPESIASAPNQRTAFTWERISTTSIKVRGVNNLLSGTPSSDLQSVAFSFTLALYGDP